MKMTTRSILGSVAVGGISTLALSLGGFDRAQAATLVSENFGAGDPGTYNITGPLNSNFTVSAGNVDLIGSSTPFDLYPGNGDYIDLNGNQSGTITSINSFTFATGESATLSFDYGTNGPGTTANVFLGSTLLASLTAPTGSSFVNFNQTFTAPTNGTLRFESTNGGFGGIVLDNIELTSNPAVVSSTEVPEPSDIVGTAFAFGSVVLLKRKLSKKSVKSDRFSK